MHPSHSHAAGLGGKVNGRINKLARGMRARYEVNLADYRTWVRDDRRREAHV